MLLIAEQNVVEQGAVRGQEGAGDFERLSMPILRLICLLCRIKIFKAANFFLKLDDEANLRAYTEVAHAQEANRFQEGESV